MFEEMDIFNNVEGVPNKNAPTLQYHILKNVEFDVFKFSTVI